MCPSFWTHQQDVQLKAAAVTIWLDLLRTQEMDRLPGTDPDTSNSTWQTKMKKTQEQEQEDEEEEEEEVIT